MSAKRISVADEVHTIRRTVEGAAFIATAAMQEEDAKARRLQPLIAGILTLAGARMKDLELALIGEIDPERLVGSHNEASDTSGRKDVVLTAWSQPPVTRKTSKNDSGVGTKK